MSFISTPNSHYLRRATPLAVAVITSLAISACAFKTDGPPEDPRISVLQEQLDASRGVSQEELEHNFIPGPIENDYKAVISWPKNRPVLVSIKLLNGIVDTFDGRSQNSFEMACRDGRIKYEISVISVVAGSRVLNRFNVDELCPVDYTVVKNSANTKILKEVTGRLFLKNGASISLADESLSLNLSSLIIEGSATIKTFDEKRSSSWNKDLKTKAPSITIRAKNAVGLLKLELNGIDGIAAWDRPDVLDPSLDGAKGADGTFTERCPPERRTKTGETVSGKCSDVCTRNPGQGVQGRQPMDKLKDGTLAIRKGEKGYPGNPGVGTSKVNLQIAEVTNFETRIVFNPGKASAPGKGALPKGGRGGPPGGNPGAGCTNATTGLNGADGERGDEGSPAPNGSCEIIYISQNLSGKIKAEDQDLSLPCASLPAIIQVRDLIEETPSK